MKVQSKENEKLIKSRENEANNWKLHSKNNALQHNELQKVSVRQQSSGKPAGRQTYTYTYMYMHVCIYVMQRTPRCAFAHSLRCGNFKGNANVQTEKALHFIAASSNTKAVSRKNAQHLPIRNELVKTTR